MSTVVLYCWCHSDSASVLLYFTLMCTFVYQIVLNTEEEGFGYAYRHSLRYTSVALSFVVTCNYLFLDGIFTSSKYKDFEAYEIT